MILERLEVGPYASNCYIVGEDATMEGIIIDPGAEPQMILDMIEDMKLKIKTIVVTHGHIDHINALGKVKEGTGAPVAIHVDDAVFLKKPFTNSFGLSQEPVTPDKLLKGGDSIDVGGMKFLVIHTPGHSRGSICLLGQGALFSGDTLFNFGIGRYDLPGGSYEQIMNSIHTKLLVLPGNTVVYPGHGPETTIDAERSGNPFLKG